MVYTKRWENLLDNVTSRQDYSPVLLLPMNNAFCCAIRHPDVLGWSFLSQASC